MTDTGRSSVISDVISDYSPSENSPSSSYNETSNVASLSTRGSSPSKSISSSSNSTLIQNNISVPNSNYLCYPISKQQLSSLLMKDLQKRRDSNRGIDQRLIADEKTFKEIEEKLNKKIEKYQIRYNVHCTLLENKENINININHFKDVVQNIIDLDTESIEIKKEIRKKKWYKDRNALYRKISENNALMNEIDGITQKIDYWQQMIVAGMSRGQMQNTAPNSIVSNGKRWNATPFVVKESLRIRAENEETLTRLRKQLDEIRANRT